MDKILQELVKLLEEKKAKNIKIYDVVEIMPIIKYVVIVTATSTPHVISLSNVINDFFKQHNIQRVLPTTTQMESSPWRLVDGNDIIVHIFKSETRDLYNLEKLYFKAELVYSEESKGLF